MRTTAFISVLLLNLIGYGQNKFVFKGQASALGGYAPDSELEYQVATRYIPEINYIRTIDSNQLFDIEVSTNISGALSFSPFDTSQTYDKVSPYRMWARYSGKQLEVRAGLQKIDFGSATLLRPLQWFNEIDPRDPLQLTNGVYGLLGKYSFMNNASIWLWGLYGNEKTRGFDALQTNSSQPELGGRFQYPTKSGEIALSYHHRKIDASSLMPLQPTSLIGEQRIALDGKWDKKVGLWFEASHSFKNQNLGVLTNQTMLNIGTDYTFGIGNGLNVIGEHLSLAYYPDNIQKENIAHISAATASYPLGLFDNLMSIVYYNWETSDPILFLNYQHSFKQITGYIMAYYNPASTQGIRQNDFSNSFTGPGIRLMCVYNH